jgi:thiol-disulfide isomerase/thioredoxin
MRSLLIPLLSAGLALTGATAQAASQTNLPPALTPYSGKVLYVDFWASWCVPCAQSFPWLNSVKARYGNRLQVVAVNVDENYADAEGFLTKHPADFKIVYDPSGGIAERYHVAGMPSAVIIGRDGRVLHQHVGFRDTDTGAYESAIENALGTGGGGAAP